MPFLMIRNDITKVAADAVVDPANRNLLQGSGTSRASYQAAGEQELAASCEAIGRCDLGRAVCTPAFGLPAKYIFHAVCPAWHGGGFGEAEQLAGAYHSALELAAEYHCESVAFPLLSSGNYGYPKEQAFRIAVDTITQYVMEHDLTVYLVLYDRDSLAVSRKLFASVEEYIDDHYVAQNDESYGFGRRRREQRIVRAAEASGRRCCCADARCSSGTRRGTQDSPQSGKPDGQPWRELHHPAAAAH